MKATTEDRLWEKYGDRDWENKRTEKERVTPTPDKYTHFCICIKYVDLRNTWKATFWSEPCTPDLHSRGKQHSNMWETQSKSGCGRKESARFHESHLMFHRCFFNRENRYSEWRRQVQIWGGSGTAFNFYLNFHFSSKGCKRGRAKLIRLNKTCSHLFCDKQADFDMEGRERKVQLKAKGGAEKGKISGWSSGQCGFSL